MTHGKRRRYLKHGLLPQLAAFDAVARLSSYSRAAETLHMAQPTVSLHIRKLTETVGLPLLEQVGRRTHVTEAGRVLQDACEEVFRALERLDDRLNALRSLEAGRLRVSAPTTAKYFIPRVLGEFCRAYPGVDASLHLTNRERLLERLAENADDLYILTEPPADLEATLEPILPNPLVVVAPLDHPLAAQRNIPLARLAQEPLLMREPGSGTRRAVVNLFAEHGLEYCMRMEMGSNEALKQAVLGGLGVAVLSGHALRPEGPNAELAILDVEGFPIRSTWHAAYAKGKELPPAAQAFLEHLRRAAKGEQKSMRSIPA